MTSEATTCAFKPCKCTVDPANAIHREGKAYCSERCADGRGCDHAHCDCGKFPGEEPEV